jgi:hypothetical protein
VGISVGKIVGIDLGTTKCVVAVMDEGGTPSVIPHHEGSRTTPSVVDFSTTGAHLVGELAKQEAVLLSEPQRNSVRRHMGSAYRVEIDGKHYAPQDIWAIVLEKLVIDASAYLGGRITEAVIAVRRQLRGAFLGHRAGQHSRRHRRIGDHADSRPPAKGKPFERAMNRGDRKLRSLVAPAVSPGTAADRPSTKTDRGNM